MSELPTMALQMLGCLAIFVPLAVASIASIFIAADWWEGRRS